MQDEIKEILDILYRMVKENKESDNPLQATVILYEILYKLLDFITNLQQENKRLNNIINEIEKYMNEERINNCQIDEFTIMEIQIKLEELKEGKND